MFNWLKPKGSVSKDNIIEGKACDLLGKKDMQEIKGLIDQLAAELNEVRKTEFTEGDKVRVCDKTSGSFGVVGTVRTVIRGVNRTVLIFPIIFLGYYAVLQKLCMVLLRS